MIKLSSPGHEHADRVLQTVRTGLTERSDDVVAQSWLRCVNDHRLHPQQMRPPQVVPRSELEERRSAQADVLNCARFEMTSLYQQLADDESAVLLTDTDGVILHMVASPEFTAEAARLGMRPGARWAEADVGTNGPGTCLAAGQPVSVRRDEHFFTQLTELTCSAVPVHDPSGTITAALDVTSRSTLQQQHVLVLLGMTARMIENRLLDVRFRHAHPLYFHSRPEFVHTLHEGRLAVDADGRVLAANRSALFQLGMASAEAIRDRRIDSLFQTSLPELLQRCAAAAYHPVVAFRAEGAHRFFVVARKPLQEAEAEALRLAQGALRAAGAGAGALVEARRAPPAAARRHEPAPRLFKDERLTAQLGTARKVIARGTPVLLSGETGAGKEVFARAVHEASPLAQGPFVAVNCACLPEALIESELFGYRAGAFTGAQRTGRRGKIMQADGGTLFLDEIADMPLELQARLLRVLDERQVTPLGTEEVHPVHFQLVSASHQHLPTRVAEGRFREDLYYRLAGIELALPPLRERQDKRELILAMLRDEGGEGGLSAEAERLLMAHPWPGNVRQLRHALRSAAALADGATVTLEHLSSLMSASVHPGGLVGGMVGGLSGGLANVLPQLAAPAHLGAPGPARSLPAPEAGSSEPERPPVEAGPPLNPIQANERLVLLQLLEQHRWNVSNVAKALDVSRNTLYRKLHKLRIPLSHPV